MTYNRIGISLQSFREYTLANPTKTCEEIGKFFKIDTSSVYMYAKSVGIKRARNRDRQHVFANYISYEPRIAPQEEIVGRTMDDIIAHLAGLGYSPIEVCLTLNITIGFVNNALRRMSWRKPSAVAKVAKQESLLEEDKDEDNIYLFMRDHVNNYLETGLFPDLEKFIKNMPD